LENLTALGLDVALVVVEEDAVADILRQILLGAGLNAAGRRGGRRRGIGAAGGAVAARRVIRACGQEHDARDQAQEPKIHFVLPRKYLGLVCDFGWTALSADPSPLPAFGKRTPAAVSESGGTILIVNQGIKGDHAGSDASCGVITSRSLYPVKSIEYSRGPPPLPCLSVGIWRKYMS